MLKTPILKRAPWRSVRAKVLVQRGDLSVAPVFARESIERADTPTDFLHLRWHVHASAGDATRRQSAGCDRDVGVGTRSLSRRGARAHDVHPTDSGAAGRASVFEQPS